MNESKEYDNYCTAGDKVDGVYEGPEPEGRSTEILDFAIQLADFAKYSKPGAVIAFSEALHNEGAIVSVQIRRENFDRQFSNDPDVVITEMPKHGYVQRSIIINGAFIFCTETAEFVRK